jgi:hypothetical protein
MEISLYTSSKPVEFGGFNPDFNSPEFEGINKTCGYGIKLVEFDQFCSGFLKECYTLINIPARPLPQGKLNYGGFYYFEDGILGVFAVRTLWMRLRWLHG